MSSSQRIFNKMSIFRKFKFQSRHKKLTEEWALATSMKDLSDDTNEQEQQIDNNDNNEQLDEKNIKKFTLKYLGKTSIDSERSQNATAEAIKSVITNSKQIRLTSNNKKSQRIQLVICPKGIEMKDLQTNDILLRVSIYKISYCSADATHDHVFAFIGSEDDKNTGEEKLSCYVFLCPKRRVAHEVTLTVAKCFENAYQMWRNSIEQKIYDPNDVKKNHSNNMFSTKTKKLSSLGSSKSSSIDEDKSSSSSSSQDSSTDNLLIDLSQDVDEKNLQTTMKSTNILDACQTDRRNYLQNTWVSFDDEQLETRQSLFQENSSAWDTQLVF